MEEDVKTDLEAIELLRGLQDQIDRLDFEAYCKLDRIINHIANQKVWENLG